MIEKKLLRIDEAAEILSFSQSKIYELIKEGKLRTACDKGVGKKPVRIIRTSIDEYIDNITVDPDDWKDPQLSRMQDAQRPQTKRRIISRGLKKRNNGG